MSELLQRVLIAAPVLVAFVLAVFGFLLLDKYGSEDTRRPRGRIAVLFVTAFGLVTGAAVYGAAAMDPEIGFFTVFLGVALGWALLGVWRALVRY